MSEFVNGHQNVDKPETSSANNGTILALDIGTRKIAGTVMTLDADNYLVCQAHLEEQLPGAMQDGQIHDIAKTARIIRSIKTELEARCNTVFTEAAVAAAGRSLVTKTAIVEQTVALHKRLTAEEVKSIELEAVSQALTDLQKEEKGEGVADTFLCVGYSVIDYRLDGSSISALVGHQGRRAGVEVIATFLPSIVVNSLAAALQECDLTMASLTLEPIAAIHLVVPNTMRMLNIALVDIGAGTSDIALSQGGTVRAYGMVPAAGDEITQALAEHYLLDFMVAEQLKRLLGTEQPLHCMDALGNEMELDRSEVLQVLEAPIQNLVEQITAEILRCNNGTPKGVVIVGGGGLTPGLPTKLADALELPHHLVRLRIRENLSSIQGSEDFVGPQVITPIAIGAAHLDGQAMALQRVTVNDTPFQFLRMAHSTVGDALLHAGISGKDLYGRPGEAITIELNNETVTIPGTLGSTAALRMNAKRASLRTPLTADAVIQVEDPAPGQGANARLGDIVEMGQEGYTLVINGDPYAISVEVTVNGRYESSEYLLQDGDAVRVKEISTVGQALDYLQLSLPEFITITCNETSVRLGCRRTVLQNGAEMTLSSYLQPGMELDIELLRPTVADLLEQIDLPQQQTAISVEVNGQPVRLEAAGPQLTINGEPAEASRELYQGDHVQWIQQNGAAAYILSDIFRVLDRSQLPKGQIILLVNGEKSGYTRPIKTGDKIQVRTR